MVDGTARGLGWIMLAIIAKEVVSIGGMAIRNRLGSITVR
jgi:hypothetical protein